MEHRRVKRFYARTNKNKFARQCARIERRQRILRQMNKSAQKGKQKEDGSTHPKVALAVNQSDPLPFTSPRAHHHISESTRYFETIPKFLGNLQDDPAIQVTSLTSSSDKTKYTYCRKIRTFFPGYGRTSSAGSEMSPGPVTKWSIPMKNYIPSPSSTIASFATRLCG